MKNVLFALLLLFSASVASEPIPPPVNLPIPNIHEQKPGWCWAAVAQQIIGAIPGFVQTPQQCALVAMANGVRSYVCCAGIGNPACVRSGSMQQVQKLIERFGGRLSPFAPPADPMALYETFSSGKAIILHVKSSRTPSHFVVLTGMAFVPNGSDGVEPVVRVNDPLAHYVQPIPFTELLSIWIEALVVDWNVLQKRD